MEISLKLVNSQQDIKNQILSALADELQRPFRIAIPGIKAKIREMIAIKLQSSPEFKSLMGGQLQGELGVPDAYSKFSSLLDIWLNTINITHSPIKVIGNRIHGGITITAIDASFDDVLSLETAKYTTEKGQVIPWLSWLIEAGHQFLVRDYSVVFSAQNLSNSRTGLAVMTVTPATSWRVPKEFAGTIENNFVTRALHDIETQVLDIIEKEIESKI